MAFDRVKEDLYVFISSRTLDLDIISSGQDVDVTAVTLSNDDLTPITPKRNEARVGKEGAQYRVVWLCGKVGRIVVSCVGSMSVLV
jgi:hypothetical protein